MFKRILSLLHFKSVYINVTLFFTEATYDLHDLTMGSLFVKNKEACDMAWELAQKYCGLHELSLSVG